MRRHNNDGLRKLCDCPRRGWAKCSHPWHFNFKWNGEYFRFSLERSIRQIVRGTDGKWQRDRSTLGDPITSKTAADSERDRLRAAIRQGTLQRAEVVRPQRETLTLAQLMETYRKRYIVVQRPNTHNKHGDAKGNLKSQIALILRTELERPDGTRLAFGEWPVVDITSDSIEQFQRARMARGVVAANRDLALLGSMFSWAVRRDHIDRTPFKKGTEVVVRLKKETKRSRRLRPGEADQLLAGCSTSLRVIVEAALETGCRKGELLSLQWSQVRFEPKAELFLPAQKTKTKTDRIVPMSSRLKAILEMRRQGPDGKDHPQDSFVLGNEAGERVMSFKRAWEAAVLRAHGHKPTYVIKTRTRLDGRARKVKTGVLTPESRAIFRTIGLHFHDLRREAGVSLAR
jgi:integrase